MLRACTKEDILAAIEEYRVYRRTLGRSEKERAWSKAIGGMVYVLFCVLERMEQSVSIH